METKLINQHEIFDIAREVIPTFPIDAETLAIRYHQLHNGLQRLPSSLIGNLFELYIQEVVQELCKAFPHNMHVETLEQPRSGNNHELILCHSVTPNIVARSTEKTVPHDIREYDIITILKRKDEEIPIVWNPKSGKDKGDLFRSQNLKSVRKKVDKHFRLLRYCYPKSKHFGYVFIILEGKEFLPWYTIPLLESAGIVVITYPLHYREYAKLALEAGRKYNLILE